MAVTIDGVGEINGVTLPSGDGAIATTSDLALVHINTTTFSAVSSVSLNDVFSSAYDNYSIWLYLTKTSYLTARLRVSGVDASGSDYDQRLFNLFSTSVNTTLQTNSSSMQIGENATVTYTNIQLFNPHKAARTVLKFDNFDENELRNRHIVHKLTNAYDGISLIPTSGTITGTIRVYGYKNGVSA